MSIHVHTQLRRFFAVLVLFACLGTARAEDVPHELKPLPVPPAPTRPPITLPPHRFFWLAKDGGPPNLLVPALEVPLFDIALWGVDRARGKAFTHISPASMWQRLIHGPWLFDDDNILVNEVAHPFHGSIGFTMARSSGWNFWESIPFAIFESLFWTTFLENDGKVSINDIITTPLGGIFWGEALWRSSLLLLDDDGPTFLRWLGSVIFTPIGAFNLFFFGRKEPSFFPEPAHYVRFTVGVGETLDVFADVAGRRINGDRTSPVLFGFDIVSGVPGDRRWKFERPFDHFIFSGRLGGWSGGLNSELFVRGLVAGHQFDSGASRGLWGLFGGYEFTQLNTLRVFLPNQFPGYPRVTTVNLGLGLASQHEVARNVYLQPTLILSGVPFGAAGSIVQPVMDRDYHYGFGGQAWAELQLIDPVLGRLDLLARPYAIGGDIHHEGWEFFGMYSVTGEVAITAHQGIGLKVLMENRFAEFYGAAPQTHQWGSQVTLYWTWLSSEGYRALVGAD